MRTMPRDLRESTSQLLQLAHRPAMVNPVGPGVIIITTTTTIITIMIIMITTIITISQVPTLAPSTSRKMRKAM